MDEWMNGCREDRERERKVCVKLGFFLCAMALSTVRLFDTSTLLVSDAQKQTNDNGRLNDEHKSN